MTMTDNKLNLDAGVAGLGTAIALSHLLALMESKGLVSLEEVHGIFGNTLNALGEPMKAQYEDVIEAIMPLFKV